jgi:hypothetical protein
MLIFLFENLHIKEVNSYLKKRIYLYTILCAVLWSRSSFVRLWLRLQLVKILKIGLNRCGNLFAHISNCKLTLLTK